MSDEEQDPVGALTGVELNDATIEADDVELFERYLALAEGKLAERDFAVWLRKRLRFAAQGEVHEPRDRYRAK